jgi:hypothetical protein
MASIVIAGDTSGTVTLAAPATAGTTTLTLPTTDGTVITTGSTGDVSQAMLATGVAGTGPAFSAYSSSSQSVTSATFTKINFDTELFDTNNNFASSRFTPTVAGYYQINAYLTVATAVTRCLVTLYKNGSRVAILSDTDGSSANTSGGSTLIYFNGSTDYIEVYGYLVGVSPQFFGASDSTYFSGSLVRSA